MKRVEERRPPSVIVFRVLVVIASLLVFLLIAGTIYGFAKRGKVPEPPPAPDTMAEESVFSGLGKMRISTGDNETLIISIAFPYDKADRPFSEELASCISSFKNTITEYLGAFSAEELASLNTDTVSEELLKRFNSALRLGQIRELYILEYVRL